MKTRVADYIIDYIYKHGTDTIFTIAGGGAMFLNDAVAVHKKILCVCNHHEQASAMAAEAYAKMNNAMGAVMVTSGPGSTNAITGLMEAYQNSIPVLFISSQAKQSQMIPYSGVSHLRQFGIQEVNIIPLVRHLTKYASIVNTPEDIRYEMEKAYYFAREGRAGPVWLDIPPNIAASQLPKKLRSFPLPLKQSNKTLDAQIQKLIPVIQHAGRPLIIAGGGIKLAGARNEFRTWIEKVKIPVVTPDMGIDILEYDHPYYIGHGGTKGDRAANIAIQQSDLIIAIGTRLAVPFIGHEYTLWAPHAHKIVIDIDPEEHRKKTIHIDTFLRCDAKYFLQRMSALLQPEKKQTRWVQTCQLVKKDYAFKYAIFPKQKRNKINMYDAVSEISKQSKQGDVFITDAGTTAYVVTQGIKIKQHQRMIIPGATLTMGYNLPAVIGVWAADKNRRSICITGDGSFQMNIHELATIAHNNIPAKIFVMDNQGYHAIRTTQKTFFNGRLIGEGKQTGISFPDLKMIAAAYHIRYFCAQTITDLPKTIKQTLASKGAAICSIRLPYWQDIITVSSKKMKNGTMVSRPLDDMYPFLPERETQTVKKMFQSVV